MKKLFLILFSFSILLFPLLATNAQLASDPAPGANQPTPSGSLKLTNPLGVDTPQELIGQVINAVLGVVGSIALLMFVFGGLTWMTSSGNPEKVKKGRDIIIWSVVGLAVIFMSYALTRVVLTAVVAK